MNKSHYNDVISSINDSLTNLQSEIDEIAVPDNTSERSNQHDLNSNSQSQIDEITITDYTDAIPY
jgi:hypothetical protein